ncbi:hypothetical protein ZIOFF_044760 [Zingiber officinale]|uniref:Uncharacterized protein n=1 Tax=Zingiber officinale TaxID=94328 RepID=A0A8J5L0E3_ZINOF|nr:hypothetical protein ZIOFF_044760 [Zingiber officinale]
MTAKLGNRLWSSPPVCREPQMPPTSCSRSWWIGIGRRRASDPISRRRSTFLVHCEDATADSADPHARQEVLTGFR